MFWVCHRSGSGEVPVADLIFGVIVDILRHVPIKLLKGWAIKRIPTGRESGKFVLRISTSNLLKNPSSVVSLTSVCAS
jgi:hypothetical protein